MVKSRTTQQYILHGCIGRVGRLGPYNSRNAGGPASAEHEKPGMTTSIKSGTGIVLYDSCWYDVAFSVAKKSVHIDLPNTKPLFEMYFLE